MGQIHASCISKLNRLTKMFTSGMLSTHPSGKTHLSQPRGPHSVGYVDVMTSGVPESGCFMRLYYPTDEQCLTEHKRWPIWASEDKYISGIFTFMRSMIYRWPSWAPRSEFLFYNKVQHLVKLVPYFGFTKGFKFLFGHVYVPIIENATIKNPESGKSWPVAVFSHGIGCSRTMYSQVCYDMASYGMVVAATEHRDGSACMSRYYSSNTEGVNDVKWVEHYKCETNEDEYALRNRQVHLRSKEASRTLDLLIALNNGESIVNVFDLDLSNPTQSQSENLSSFKEKLDVSKPIMSGHSFGGATTLLTLAEDSRFKVGIALDAWLYPIKELDLSKTIQQPVLFINTESFLNTRNLNKMATFQSTESQGTERKSYYIRGTVHQNHLDLPFLVPQTAVKKVLGLHSETSPDIVMNINNKLMVQFIFKHSGVPTDSELDQDIIKNNYLLREGFDISDTVPTTDW